MQPFNDTGAVLDHVGSWGGRAELQNQLMREGFNAFRHKMTEARDRRVRSAGRLMSDVITGREDAFLLKQAFHPTKEYAVQELLRKYPGVLDLTQLRETVSVTDYSALTVDVLDRMLYGYYDVAQITNRPLVKMHPLRDFRTVKRFEMDGATTPFTKISPGEPPKQRAMTQATPITYSPDAYAGLMSVNWRAIVNDDLGIFADQTQRLAISGMRTIYKAITSTYVDAAGPHASLYTSGFANIINTTNGAASNNPPLSFQGLIDAITVLAKQLDTDGQPIIFNGTLYLWFGPSLKTTAMALLNSMQADISVGGGTTNTQGFPSQRLRVASSYITGGLVPIEDKYIPIVCTASGIKNTMWGLTYAPESQNRPSVEFGFLTGFETPQLFQKAPNTMRVSGGLDATLGDFLTMDQDFKAITVFGGTQVDGRSTVASNGSGT